MDSLHWYSVGLNPADPPVWPSNPEVDVPLHIVGNAVRYVPICLLKSSFILKISSCKPLNRVGPPYGLMRQKPCG